MAHWCLRTGRSPDEFYTWTRLVRTAFLDQAKQLRR